MKSHAWSEYEFADRDPCRVEGSYPHCSGANHPADPVGRTCIVHAAHIRMRNRYMVSLSIGIMTPFEGGALRHSSCNPPLTHVFPTMRMCVYICSRSCLSWCAHVLVPFVVPYPFGSSAVYLVCDFGINSPHTQQRVYP